MAHRSRTDPINCINYIILCMRLFLYKVVLVVRPSSLSLLVYVSPSQKLYHRGTTLYYIPEYPISHLVNPTKNPSCTLVHASSIPIKLSFQHQKPHSAGPNFPTMNQPRLFLGFNPHSSVVFNPKAVQRWLFQPPKPPGASGAARCSARPRRPKTRRRGRPPPAAPR